MNQIQQDRRRAAARAFMESLEQLENRLKTEESNKTEATSRRDRPTTPSPRPTAERTLADDFEEALADIDHLKSH